MRILRLAIAALVGTLASAAHAQPIVVADSGDNGWMLAASALVFIAAVPGLALFHMRTRSSQVGLAQVASIAILTLLFTIIGYSLAFSDGTGLLGGTGNVMLAGLADVQPDTTISGSIYALFELTISAFAVAILVASIAERTRIGWLLAFTTLWIMLVYVPVAHWVWGGGWIAALGALDYSGGIVVQTTAGVSSLVIAILVGRDRGSAMSEEGSLAAVGAILMWVGWLAVIGGSGFAATGDAADAMLNAQLATSAAVVVGLIIERIRTGSITANGAVAAAIAGLAAVSAGAGFIGPAGAILVGVIGAFGAWLAMASSRLLNLGLAPSAFIAHGGGAILGATLFPVFILPAFGGPGLDEGISLGGQLATQGVAVVAVALWAAVATGIAALMTSMVLPMVDRDDDRK
jgi:ammonium transporter, Amt family